jgi:sialic acid synthase SpsE
LAKHTGADARKIQQRNQFKTLTMKSQKSLPKRMDRNEDLLEKMNNLTRTKIIVGTSGDSKI